jgi:threonine aldolase
MYDHPATGGSERYLASDNCAGVHAAVIEAIAAANGGHVCSYGDDHHTAAAQAAIRRLVGDNARVFFAFNGTGANVVALAAALRPYQAVICPADAHLNLDECGAFERFAGSKLLTVPTRAGKLAPADVRRYVAVLGDVHHAQPGAISISQATEVGTVYTLDELAALGAVAREYGLFFHVDGARLANAAVTLDTDLHAMLTLTGVDAFTFGGTKNGLLFGEAIVFPKDHPAVERVAFTRKQGMQLASKMRFVAAQFEALLRDDLWRRSAAHANAMAQRLAARLASIEGVRIVYPVEANGIFAAIPPQFVAPLQAEKRFYVWDEGASVVRWMTAFDTTEADVDGFADAIERLVSPAVGGAAVGNGVPVSSR